MFVHCEITCDTGQVSTNTLDGGGSQADGLLVTNSSGGTGLTISGNLISNMSGHGLEVDGDGANTLSSNTVTNSSDTDDFFGIFLNSDDNVLSASTVTGGYDNGIEVAGDTNNVHDNINVSNNGEDGIHIATGATANTINKNKTLGNQGEGLENDGTNTVLTNNTSTGNRQDCAGTGTTNPVGTAANPGAQGNTCSDGSKFNQVGPITAPVRRHRTTH